MCTGFVSFGNDYIAGFNLDVDPAVWDFRVYTRRDCFFAGLRMGSTTYRIHGVNAAGRFAVLPYMNGAPETMQYRGRAYTRIDLINHKLLSGKLDGDALDTLLNVKQPVNVPNTSMHALYADPTGRITLVEPKLGIRRYGERHAVIANYPLLTVPDDLTENPFYGTERYHAVENALTRFGEGLTVQNALDTLLAVRQTGQWATRLTFVYAHSENAVYYITEDAGETVKKHIFIKRS